MGAVVMVLRGRFRRHWKSWLALSVLVAVAGGFVLATAAAGRRTAAAFPDFVARHGYNVVVYSGQPLPDLARLPHVASVTPVLAPYSGTPVCASCRHPIDDSSFLINEVPPGQLQRMVTLLSGRMPDQSDPGEVLASFTLAKDNGVRIGSVIQVPLASPAQLASGKIDGPPAARPTLRVVGIVAAEAEFPSGASPHYDLYTTTAFATAVNHRAALLSTYYVRFVHGAADLAGFDGRLRQLKLDVYGTLDLDAAAAAVEASIAPQVIGWYVLAGLAALAALAVIGQAMARQTVAEMADHRDLSALGVRPREFVLLAMVRAGLIGTAGAVGAMLAAVLVSPLTPVGEARLAVPAPGSMSFEPVVLPLGALAVLAAVIAVSIWPAVRHARLPGRRSQPAMPIATAAGRSAARAGLPPTAVIGIRHALERGRDGQPVGTALLGMATAVAALCATAVFGTSLAHLITSPALYGAPFQAYCHPGALAAGQRGQAAGGDRVAQGARVRRPPGRRRGLLAGYGGSADRNRDRGSARHRGGKGVLAGVRHELRRCAGRCGRAAADGGTGGGGGRRRQRGSRGSRAAGRAITSGPAAQGRVRGWSGKPLVREPRCGRQSWGRTI